MTLSFPLAPNQTMFTFACHCLRCREEERDPWVKNQLLSSGKKPIGLQIRVRGCPLGHFPDPFSLYLDSLSPYSCLDNRCILCIDLLLTGVVRLFAAFIQSWLAISVKMNMFSFLGYICWCSICHLNDFPSSKETSCCAKGNASKVKRRAVVKKEHVKVCMGFIPYGLYWKGHIAPPWHCTSVRKKCPWFCHRNRACMSTISTLGRCSFPTLDGDHWTVGRKTSGFDIKKVSMELSRIIWFIIPYGCFQK